MLLYLLRHADAEDHARALTSRGLTQAGLVGAFLQKHQIDPGLILSSPVLRAMQTADIVRQKTGAHEKLIDPRLACGMSPETGMEIIREHQRFESLLLVGHQPDLGDLAARLLSRDDSFQINFGKAALLAIDLHMARTGGGVLEFFLPAGLLH